MIRVSSISELNSKQGYESLRRMIVAAVWPLIRNRADAEDILQAALLRAIERHEGLPTDVNLGAWLRTVARHIAVDSTRQRKRRCALEDCDELAAETDEAESDPPWSLVSPEQLRVALACCERDHREVFALRYHHGLSYRQIADRLQIPMGTVATRLHRAREQVRMHIERAGMTSYDQPKLG